MRYRINDFPTVSDQAWPRGFFVELRDHVLHKKVVGTDQWFPLILRFLASPNFVNFFGKVRTSCTIFLPKIVYRQTAFMLVTCAGTYGIKHLLFLNKVSGFSVGSKQY